MDSPLDGCSLRISTVASVALEPQHVLSDELASSSHVFIQLEPKQTQGNHKKTKQSIMNNCKSLYDQSIGYGLQRLRHAWSHQPPPTESMTGSGSWSGWCNGMPPPSTHKIKQTIKFFRANHVVFHREIFCGFASTLLMIPETVAFSYVANLNPLMGLYATGIIGLVVGIFGAVPATVAGAAGALAVVMPQLTSADGSLGNLPYETRVDHLVMAIWLAGWLQLVFGMLNLSQVFVMIPRTAHIGFLNGLSIMMFVSQNTTFKVCKPPHVRADGTTSMPLTASTHHNFYQCQLAGELEFMSLASASTWMTICIVLVTICIMVFYSKVCRKISKVVPPTLIVAIVGVAIEFGINRPFIHAPVRTIGETSPFSHQEDSSNGTRIVHPTLQFVPKVGSIENWSAVVSCAVTLACVGLLESIMTLQAICDLTKQTFNPRKLAKTECIAQGIANVLCGSANAMAGCSMIGQSTGNILNGATTRLSSIMAGISMFMAITFASGVIELVPVACLTGILYVIIAHTFDWQSLVLLFRLPVYDAFAIVMVTTLAARINLVVAVVAGVLWQSLVHSWHNGLQLTCEKSRETITLVTDQDGNIRAEPQHPTRRPLPPTLGMDTISTSTSSSSSDVHEIPVYWLRGPIVFASIGNFRSFFDYDQDASDWVLVDCSQSQLGDFSAVCALEEVAIRYRNVHKTLVVRELDPQSMERLGFNTTKWHIDNHGWVVAASTIASVPDSLVTPCQVSPAVQQDDHDSQQIAIETGHWMTSSLASNRNNYHQLQDEPH